MKNLSQYLSAGAKKAQPFLASSITINEPSEALDLAGTAMGKAIHDNDLDFVVTVTKM
jgi:hypothetical protein